MRTGPRSTPACPGLSLNQPSPHRPPGSGAWESHPGVPALGRRRAVLAMEAEGPGWPAPCTGCPGSALTAQHHRSAQLRACTLGAMRCFPAVPDTDSSPPPSANTDAPAEPSCLWDTPATPPCGPHGRQGPGPVPRAVLPPCSGEQPGSLSVPGLCFWRHRLPGGRSLAAGPSGWRGALEAHAAGAHSVWPVSWDSRAVAKVTAEQLCLGPEEFTGH